MKLIVIDMQKALMDDELYNFHGLIENLVKLIAIARENRTEVLYVQHDAGPGTGFSVGDEAFEIADEVAPREGEKVFVKKINSCFGNRDFTAYLEESGDKDLMIAGLQTNFCIDATVKSAFERGYHVILPEGTNSTFDNPYMSGETTCAYYFNEVWPDLFADCIPLEEAEDLLKNNA
ncbi:MAG: cysteine hydrolase [Lachnospiraceae bacterium]|nr:cysteine hydrolase [Lachnospiraceae bacterium]